MPKFAANLSMLFTERPALDRVDAAAEAGFAAIEFQAPYAVSAADLAARAAARGLKVVLINAPNGPNPADRGLAAMPGREADFMRDLDQALAYARALACPNVRLICGHIAEEIDRPAMERTLVANLARAAPIAAAAGVTLLLEPLNPVDAPTYLLQSPAAALAIIDREGHANVALQLDIYHCHRGGGDPVAEIERLLGRYAHVQISNSPGRTEPSLGDIDYPPLFDLFDRLGYAGWIGCEYRPSTDTLSSLAWARPWGIGVG